MRAIVYEQFGGYEQAKLMDVPRPVPEDGEVLLAMRTAGCNPLDNTFRSGHHPAANSTNLPRVGGQNGVGVAVETKSPLFSIGNRAIVSLGGFGRTVDGAWCEFMKASASALEAAPEGVNDDTAAAYVSERGK
jgi:NADPH2:quinone reductase